MVSPKVEYHKDAPSPQAMNWDFDAWMKATRFIRQIAPLIKDYKLEKKEEKVVFMAEVTEWLFGQLFGIEDELIQFTMGPNRAFLAAVDDEGRKYRISTKR